MQALRILLAASSLAAVAAGQADSNVRPSPAPFFERLSDDGGVVELGFGRPHYSRLSKLHEHGRAFVLEGMPLPGLHEAELDLRPVDVMAPGARARIVHADGRVGFLAPTVRCFAGRLVGGGTAFLGITETALHGYIYGPGAEDGGAGELYFLSSEPGKPGRATLSSSTRLGTLDAGLCRAVNETLVGEDGSARMEAPTLRTADVFIEADHEFRARFATNRECVDYTALLLTAAGEIYRRDIGTRFRIPNGYLRVWNTVPPWGRITGFNQLSNVYTWWQSEENPLRDIPRAAVHVLTHPIFGGTSRGVDGLCRNHRAYEISSLAGRFPYPRLHTDRYNWDLFVVCHEFGHTFGSPHSSLYQPPIECLDGSGPDSGTLMSYCHVQYGIARVGMRFHLREQQRILSRMDTYCLASKPLKQGTTTGAVRWTPPTSPRCAPSWRRASVPWRPRQSWT